jgi:hypothetical protein
VLDIFLEVVHHIFSLKEKHPNILEEVSYTYFYFLFHVFLGGENYGVPFGTVVTGILDMRLGKHNLHFLVGVDLLPHVFVNIYDEKMHIGVFLFIFIFFYIYLYIFIHSSLPV